MAFGFVFVQLFSGWAELKVAAAGWSFSPFFIALSALFVFANFFMSAAAYMWIVNALGQRLNYRNAFYIFFTSQLGRYIPGKFWIFLGQAYLAEKAGITKTAAATGGIYHAVVGNLSGLVLASLLLLAGYGSLASPWLMSGAAIGITLVLLFAPAQMERVLNWALAKAGKDSISLSIPAKVLVPLILWLMLAWLVNAMAFAALVRSVMPMEAAAFFPLAAVFIGGYVIGFFAFFIPGGLGVREGLFTALVPAVLGIPAAAASVLAIVSRLVITFCELGAFLIARFTGLKYNNGQGRNKDK